ncbi:MAG: hypothetical protein ACC628_15960 [Pirellulaceae bacterium]
MANEYTQSELEAYVDEALSPEDMASLERAIREQPDLIQRLAAINTRRDAGVHTLGEVWRRFRVSCPTREQLGSFLLEAHDAKQIEYIRFHIEKTGCRFCRANLDDMKRQQDEAAEVVVTRRSKYFQSSAGYLRGDR